MHDPKIYIKNYIKNIPASMKYKDGEDYEEWKNSAKEKLCALLGMDKFQKCDLNFKITGEQDVGDRHEIYFTYQSEEGYEPKACLVIPNNIKKPLPLVVCLQGHSTGMHISLGKIKYDGDEKLLYGGDRDFAVRAVKEGCAALCIEQRGFGECGGSKEGPQCHVSTMANLLVGRTTIGERIWDIMRALDAAEQNFSNYADMNKVICMGNSGGGTVTFYASCLEDRIKCAMPSCAVCSYDESIVAMRHCTCNFIPNIRLFFNMGDLGGLIAPKYLVVVSGKDDEIFPIKPSCETFESIKRFYKLLKKEENICHIIGNGGHRFYADEAWSAMNKYIEKL